MNTQNPLHRNGRSGDTVRHSKQDALSEIELEYLLEGSRDLDFNYYYEPDPEFVIYTLGKLGLRRGEIAHMKESWIDYSRKMITIPEHEKCKKGKHGEVCGYCKQLARQRVEHSEELSLKEALEWMWVPKTQAAAREIYYGFDPRLELYIKRYFDNPHYNKVEVGANGIHRRVKRAAKNAPNLTPENLSPHKLRATAATFHAGRGLETLALMQFFGWADPSTAEVYISRNGQNTANQLNAIHNR